MVTYSPDNNLPFRALADGRRRRILVLLSQSTLSVGEIAGEFTVSRPAISKHLRILERAGLVSEVREGRRHVYRMEPAFLEGVRLWLENLEPREGKRVKEGARRRVAQPVPAEKQVAAPAAVSEEDWKQW